ncbi:MAG: bifunctional DNA primase/polymerase [Bifidobacteriaceae bacterium]|jgi:hypothetical protein|nr:bifunctional DNA primase/polymerase [Bifidobacteriaceae bacterium]
MNTKVKAIIAAQKMPLRKAAPYLAANGVPVFPCAEAGKSPLVKHGLLGATADATKVERWWSRWPMANIAMPTGPASGFDVVDVDVRESGSGYESFHRAATRLCAEDWAMRVLTPSGGMHFYYPITPGRSQPNWVSGKTHIDFRGAGGYIILPPSVGTCDHDLRQPYTLVEVRTKANPIDGNALRDFLEPEWTQRRFATKLGKQPTEARANVLKAWVATRPEGERNAGLFWAACRMAEAGHGFDTTVEALAPAAEHSGLLSREIMATVRSAFRHAHPATAAAPAQPEPRPFVSSRQAVLAL